MLLKQQKNDWYTLLICRNNNIFFINKVHKKFKYKLHIMIGIAINTVKDVVESMAKT